MTRAGLLKSLSEAWWNSSSRDLKHFVNRCWDEWELGSNSFSFITLNNDPEMTPVSMLLIGEALVVSHPAGSRQSHRGLMIWEHAVFECFKDDPTSDTVQIHGLKLLEWLIVLDRSPKRFTQIMQRLRGVTSPLNTELERLHQEADATFSGRAACDVIDLRSRRRLR